MEELKKYILLLWRNRLIMIVVPLITVMITFYIVRNLPDVYASEIKIATGIVDETQQMAFSDASLLMGGQESRINQKFTNLQETLRSKNLIDLVSYQLIIHDLTSPKPYKPLTPLIKNDLNTDAKNHAIEVFREKLKNKEALNLRDLDQKGLLKLLEEMGYDYESLLKHLNIYRAGTSDFINIYFESPSADLSAFVVNTLGDVFISDYTRLVKQNQRLSVEFLEKLINIKADTLAARVNALSKYKINNRILNLTEQSTKLLDDISKYNDQKQETEKNIIARRGAIANIDKKFDPKEQKYAEAAMVEVNQDFMGTKDQSRLLYDKYIESDFDENIKKSIDSLQRIATNQIAVIGNKFISDPNSSKQALLQQKLVLEMEVSLDEYGLGSIQKHINEINKKFDQLVPYDAAIQSLDRNIDIVRKEYEDLLAQYNQVSMESEFPVKLRKVQEAMPGLPLPSKKMLLVILSGIASGTFCLLAFFVVYFLDTKIRGPKELAAITKAPVLGYLNLVGRSTLDLKGIWKNLHGTPEMLEFKKQLRSTRFEVSRELPQNINKGAILAVTSLSEGEGKTLIAACIAYTYVMINKKVLLIDGNFDNPSITVNSNTQLYIEDFLKSGDIDSMDSNSGIMVMGNHGGDNSLLEVCEEKIIRERFETLKSVFDIILIETPALDSFNKAKEWVLFADRTVSVFEANQSMTESKMQHISYLSSINGQFIGWILNKVRPESRVQHLDRATVIG